MKALLLLLVLPIGLLAQTLNVRSPVRLLALGDSYTIGKNVPPAQNWPNQLLDSMAVRNIATDSLHIIATAGWRTDNLLKAIAGKDLEAGNFNLVSLLIGTNNRYQARPFSQYTTEFPQLVDSAIRYAGGDISRVFIFSIPDYAYTPYGLNHDTAQISAAIGMYNHFNQRYADSLHIKYFNITPISELGLDQPDYVANDGFHPSAKQYSEWVKLILKTIDSINVVTQIEPELDNQSMAIYPNPVKEQLSISVLPILLNSNVQIFNALGIKMADQHLENNLSAISLLGFAPGLYTLKLTSASGEWFRKVIKN